MKYQRDKFGNTPLIYALARNSHQCVGALLNHAIHADNIVSSMHQNEINELIIFSPYNLKEFFDNSIETLEAGIPKFGIVKDGPRFVLSPDNELRDHELKKLVKTTSGENVDTTELPVVFEQIMFKQNYMPGSFDSLRFHLAL